MFRVFFDVICIHTLDNYVDLNKLLYSWWIGLCQQLCSEVERQDKARQGKQVNYTQNNSRKRRAALGGIRTHDTLLTARMECITGPFHS